jgi:hypothetical protein
MPRGLLKTSGAAGDDLPSGFRRNEIEAGVVLIEEAGFLTHGRDYVTRRALGSGPPAEERRIRARHAISSLASQSPTESLAASSPTVNPCSLWRISGPGGHQLATRS